MNDVDDDAAIDLASLRAHNPYFSVSMHMHVSLPCMVKY